MKPGDLLQVRRMGSKQFRVLGVLLEPPKFPRYGNYPMRYKVLLFSGTILEFTDEHKYIYEAVE